MVVDVLVARTGRSAWPITLADDGAIATDRPSVTETETSIPAPDHGVRVPERKAYDIKADF